jgi:hypothetical protein
VSASQATGFVINHAMLPLYNFIIANTKIIELRTRIVNVGLCVTQIQKGWLANQKYKQLMNTILKLMLLKERDAMIIYIRSLKKQNKDQKQLLEKLQTQPNSIIEAFAKEI